MAVPERLSGQTGRTAGSAAGEPHACHACAGLSHQPSQAEDVSWPWGKSVFDPASPNAEFPSFREELKNRFKVFQSMAISFQLTCG
jgi:hypothetical protein